MHMWAWLLARGIYASKYPQQTAPPDRVEEMENDVDNLGHECLEGRAQARTGDKGCTMLGQTKR